MFIVGRQWLDEHRSGMTHLRTLGDPLLWSCLDLSTSHQVRTFALLPSAKGHTRPLKENLFSPRERQELPYMPKSRGCGRKLTCILVTLAEQNPILTIIMHYSRVSTSPDKTYSAASAVLINEVLKGSISLAVAFSRTHHLWISLGNPLKDPSYTFQSPLHSHWVTVPGASPAKSSHLTAGNSPSPPSLP